LFIVISAKGKEVKNVLLSFILLTGLLNSCCLHRRTYAQSDRTDSHKPSWSPVECIPYNGLKNKPENFAWLETGGTSGAVSGGLEFGYNFNSLRLYAAVGAGWWPSPVPQTTVSGNAGIILLSPDYWLRPELGCGFTEWMLRSEQDQAGKLQPAKAFPHLPPGNYNAWQAYSGIRIAVPESSVNLGLRIYRLQSIRPGNYSGFYPGLQFGFRF
jgi:hypothetical protein